MRREFKDDLVATAVLALCTLVLLVPARPRAGATEIRLAAPGAPSPALPPSVGMIDAEAPGPNETTAAPSAPKPREVRPAAAATRLHS